MVKCVAAVAAVACAGAAFAQVSTPLDGRQIRSMADGIDHPLVGTQSPRLTVLENEASSRTVEGDSFAILTTFADGINSWNVDAAPDQSVFVNGGAFGVGTYFNGAQLGAFSFVQRIPGTNVYDGFVSIFSADSSDLIPGGLNFGSGAITTLLFDVGTAGVGSPDPLSVSGPAIQLLALDWALAVDGGLIFATGSANAFGGNDLGISEGIGGASGLGIDEQIMFFTYRQIPTPGAAALLGLGGLVAARRRR